MEAQLGPVDAIAQGQSHAPLASPWIHPQLLHGVGRLAGIEAGHIGDAHGERFAGAGAEALQIGAGQIPEGEAPLGAMAFEAQPAAGASGGGGRSREHGWIGGAASPVTETKHVQRFASKILERGHRALQQCGAVLLGFGPVAVLKATGMLDS